jgi:hypothetical protein
MCARLTEACLLSAQPALVIKPVTWQRMSDASFWMLVLKMQLGRYGARNG